MPTPILVPVTARGRRSAVVVDCLTRRPVRVAATDFPLVADVPCVPGESVRTLGGRHFVRFRDGTAAWVRPVSTVPEATVA